MYLPGILSEIIVHLLPYSLWRTRSNS